MNGRNRRWPCVSPCADLYIVSSSSCRPLGKLVELVVMETRDYTSNRHANRQTSPVRSEMSTTANYIRLLFATHANGRDCDPRQRPSCARLGRARAPVPTQAGYSNAESALKEL